MAGAASLLLARANPAKERILRQKAAARGLADRVSVFFYREDISRDPRGQRRLRGRLLCRARHHWQAAEALTVETPVMARPAATSGRCHPGSGGGRRIRRPASRAPRRSRMRPIVRTDGTPAAPRAASSRRMAWAPYSPRSLVVFSSRPRRDRRTIAPIDTIQGEITGASAAPLHGGEAHLMRPCDRSHRRTGPDPRDDRAPLPLPSPRGFLPIASSSRVCLRFR